MGWVMIILAISTHKGALFFSLSKFGLTWHFFWELGQYLCEKSSKFYPTSILVCTLWLWSNSNQHHLIKAIGLYSNICDLICEKESSMHITKSMYIKDYSFLSICGRNLKFSHNVLLCCSLPWLNINLHT